MVHELPPRISVLLAFIVFQVVAFSGILLNLSMEEILKRTLYAVILAGIFGFIMGLLLEHWKEKGFSAADRKEEGEEGDEGEEGEGSSEDREDEQEIFEELSFPQVDDPDNSVFHQQ